MSNRLTQVVYWPPIDPGDYHRICAMLRTAKVFRGVPVPGFDWFEGRHFIETQHEHGTRFFLLLDRNVVSRVLCLITAPTRPRTHQDRISAAIMGFGGITGSWFDPTIALAEQTDAGGKPAALEAALFATIQNVAPEVFVDIALGRRDLIHDHELETHEIEPRRQQAERMPLLGWGDQCIPDYGAALKLGLLILNIAPRWPTADDFAGFMRWMYDDYMILAPPIIYGGLALSPSRRSGMLKSIRSGNLDKALAGVRNAVWDMAMMRYWADSVCEGYPQDNTYYLLCTLDQALQTCATDYVVGVRGGHRYMQVRDRWVREWGLKDGERLAAIYGECMIGATTDSHRAAKRIPSGKCHWQPRIDAIEEEFKSAVRRLNC